MTISEIEVRELEAQQTAVVRRVMSLSEANRIPEWMMQTLEAVRSSGQEPAGMPFVRSFSMDVEAMDIEVGWPLAEQFAGDGEVSASTLPGGPAAVASCFGPYEEIGAAYEAIRTWCAKHGRESAGPPWESYFTDPAEEPDPAEWRTDIHFPVEA